MVKLFNEGNLFNTPNWRTREDKLINPFMFNFWSENSKLLNKGCGAEIVHKEQTPPPKGWNYQWRNKKCASFDGDADRLIYYYQIGHNVYETIGGESKIIDGDKQFIFIMKYIKGLLKELGIDDNVPTIFAHSPYTNLKAIEFYDKEGIKGQVVRTGVKNAHPVVV